ncbi:MAG: glycosyltransferase, partial [Spirochaetota bacterium]
DGGSTDGGLDIIQKYETELEYFISEPDGGIYQAMNKGLSLAQGQYINLLNADDYYYHQNVLDIVAASLLKKQPDYLCGATCFFDEHLHKLLWVWYPNELEQACSITSQPAGHQTYFIHRRAYKHIGTFPTKYRFTADALHKYYLLEMRGERLDEIIVASCLQGASHHAGKAAKMEELQIAQELFPEIPPQDLFLLKSLFISLKKHKYLSQIPAVLERTALPEGQRRKVQQALEYHGGPRLRTAADFPQAIAVILFPDSSEKTEERLALSIHSLEQQTHQNLHIYLINFRVNFETNFDKPNNFAEAKTIELSHPDDREHSLLAWARHNVREPNVMFMSAGDFLQPTALERMQEELALRRADFVEAQCYFISQTATPVNYKHCPTVGNDLHYVFHGNSCENINLSPYQIARHTIYLWGKLYRSEFLLYPKPHGGSKGSECLRLFNRAGISVLLPDAVYCRSADIEEEFSILPLETMTENLWQKTLYMQQLFG